MLAWPNGVLPLFKNSALQMIFTLLFRPYKETLTLDITTALLVGFWAVMTLWISSVEFAENVKRIKEASDISRYRGKQQ